MSSEPLRHFLHESRNLFPAVSQSFLVNAEVNIRCSVVTSLNERQTARARLRLGHNIALFKEYMLKTSV